MTDWGFIQQLLLQIAAQTTNVFCMPVFWIAVVMLVIQIRIQHRQTSQHLRYQSDDKIYKQTNKKANRKKYKKEQTAYGLSAFVYSCICVLQVILPAIITGWIGGFIASILLVMTGVSIDYGILLCMWAMAAVLCLIQRRFICFAYAGGITALIQYWAYHNCAAAQQVLMLVAVLHFTEAILVCICGDLQSRTVYFRDKMGKTTSGVQLQMTWPLPLAIPEAVHTDAQIQQTQNGFFLMPDWWPLFTMPTDGNDITMLYQLMPMLAAIGYCDCVKGNVQQRVHAASCHLICYSIILGSMVLISCYIPAMVCIAALFSIVGHETITRV